MAYIYQFSKKFTLNGAPVSTVALTDLIGVSTPVAVSPTAPWGYRSTDKNLNAIQKYTFKEFWKDGLVGLGIIKPGGGLTGAGTVADPLRVDKQWMDSRYMPAYNFPISQVGDPTDMLLPISGSYFSVSYPMTYTPYPGTAFVEGNGDLRLIHHVTNGEELRPVYALWKNYRNTDMNTMFKTDVVYIPPGLAAGEFIHNVYMASTTAMIGELWREEGFIEHVLIILNGTFVATYHQVIRLGKQVFTSLLGIPFSYENMKYVLPGLSACQVGSKWYVTCSMAPLSELMGSLYISSMVAGEIVITGTSGVIVPMKGTTTTNVGGGVTTLAADKPGFVFHTTGVSRDIDNKDAMFYMEPGINISAYGYPYSHNPANYSNIAGTTEDGKILLVLRHYFAIISPATETDLKPIYYYLLDPIAKTIVPAPGSVGMRWECRNNGAGGVSYSNRNIPYVTGHYWANGSRFQVLGDGTRLIHKVPGSADIDHGLYSWDNTNTTLMDGTNDDIYQTGYRFTATNLDPVYPTKVISGKLGTILYGNLITTNVAAMSNQMGANHVRSALIGSSKAKQYRLLQTEPSSPPKVYDGYALNNDRVDAAQRAVIPYTFVVGGTPYYHAAFFCQGQDGGHQGVYQLDNNQQSHKLYYCHKSIYDQMNAFVAGIKCPDPKWTEVFQFTWNIVPPYPGIGRQRAIVKYQISWVRDLLPEDNPADYPLGRVWFGNCMSVSVANCTISFDPDGSAQLTYLDMSQLQSDGLAYYDGTYFFSHGAEMLGWTGGVIIEAGDGSAIANWRGGGGSNNHYAGGWEAWRSLGITINPDNTLKVPFRKAANNIYPAGWHPEYGFGFVDSSFGLGCFYAWVGLKANGYDIDETKPIIILGTARPAAGFNLTVSAPISVYVNGILRTIGIQVIDLRNTKPDARWTTFHITAVVTSPTDVILEVSLNPSTDNENSIYLGKILTNETEIYEMVLEPVTRWEAKRVSTEARGSSIIGSTGFPGSAGEITAITAGIDPTQANGDITFDTANTLVTVKNNGAFYIQDKDFAIARYGNFLQTFVKSDTDNGRGWINGVEVWRGKGSSSATINRNADLRNGWNTITVEQGELRIKGPFAKRNN